MKLFRSHIIKAPILLLVVTGVLFLAWPREHRVPSGESVSSWLLGLRNNTENPEVQKKIYSLRAEEGDIPGLLRKASTIVGEHKDDFALPVNDADSASDDDIYNTLLLKWTLHQQTTPADTIIITDRQAQVPPASEKEDKTLWGQFVNSIQFVIGAYSRISDAVDYVRMILRPLVSGIAIGAP